MPDIVLSAENLGKRYILQHRDFGNYSFREQLTESARSIVQSLKSRVSPNRAYSQTSDHPSQGDFWALRQLCLTVERGEVLGIIGRNGAGKSTLLKIISRITEPTEGVLTLQGRVASLLEVGTGFHPELTGRENIYLNGAILGMPRIEIRRKFDQIVAFAEISDFLDMPVKRYSSGMYVRLAFAVAAHLEPDILIIDEVLAVGDETFQRKCLGRMSEVSKQGRTILFVSHNLGLIRVLCKRAVLLADGHLTFDGSADQAIVRYLETMEQEGTAENLLQRGRRDGNGKSRLSRIDLTTPQGAPLLHLELGQRSRIVFHATRNLPELTCSFTIFNAFAQAVASFDSAMPGGAEVVAQRSEEASFICELTEVLLIPGRYRINAGLYCSGEQVDHLDGALIFEVVQRIDETHAIIANPADGSILMPHRWIR
jgi:homopolymeric O-antigen transport system ATP-binding protein